MKIPDRTRGRQRLLREALSEADIATEDARGLAYSAAKEAMRALERSDTWWRGWSVRVQDHAVSVSWSSPGSVDVIFFQIEELSPAGLALHDVMES
ncbi:MAG: hypothetical protein BWY99_02131 [Synergistetes bacterium ADurb.BinA166]|nr:MAG: hypothetical protein BWY99_02131 [Synergistetes bacterium ADurb.BinA166]